MAMTLRFYRSAGCVSLATALGLFLAHGVALADQGTQTKAFPPSSTNPCTSSPGGAQFLGWNHGDSTYCETGQNILTNAIPSCGPYQYPVVTGPNTFACEYFGGISSSTVTCPTNLPSSAGLTAAGSTCYPLIFTTEQ